MIAITHAQKEFIQKVFQVFLPSGSTIRYFGSRVSGQHHQYSDLDIAIQSARPLEDGVIGNITAVFEGSDLPFRVDLSDYSSLSDEFRAIVDSTSKAEII